MRQCLIMFTILRIAFIDAPGMHLRKSSLLEFLRVRTLILHYAFDRWMDRTHRGVPFERYADDIVIHCTRMSEAVRIRESLTRRMNEVGLTINEEKSKIVYIDTFERHNVATSFTFLGYDRFRSRALFTVGTTTSALILESLTSERRYLDRFTFLRA